MNTADRLQAYYPFDAEVLDHVNEVADRQAGFKDYRNFFDIAGVSYDEPFTNNSRHSIQVVDIRPKLEEDKSQTFMMYLPMANALDPNQVYGLSTLAFTFPNSRIIAAGNPSGPGYGAGVLTHRQRKAVAHGDFTPVVEPFIAYAEKQGIERVIQLGDSYGADLAVTAAQSEVIATSHAIAIEPASVIKRSIKKLGADFKSSEAPLEEYVESNGLTTFLDARKDSVSGNSYILGLARATNIAVTRGLTDGNFASRLQKAIRAQRDMKATIVWGGKSELALDEKVQEIVNNFQFKYGTKGFKGIRIPEGRHAMTNDLHLRSAIILQALRG